MIDTAVTDGASASLEAEMNSLLSSSTFSVASYLNLALSSSLPTKISSVPTSGAQTDADKLQRRMTELALQLQIQTQSCHEDIGRIGAELQAILPRCAADVGRVGVGLEGMRMDAQTLLETTAITGTAGGGDSSLSSSLETLSTLHALQANLTKTKGVLTAAATWDSTISSVAPLLAEQNITEAVHALAKLEAGERALRGMPHREERLESIKQIREQVQALLQPQLRHALQNMHTRLAPLQHCVGLYSKLDKMESLRDDYVKQRPGAVHKAWFSYAPPKNAYGNSNNSANNNDTNITDENSTNAISSLDQVAGAQLAGEAFLVWLPSWYDTVLNLLTEERRQASTVFGPAEAPEIVVKVLREAFRPILPSFQSRLEMVFSSATSAAAINTTKGSFETICSIYESTLRFLSLTYDLVAGAFLDLVESGATKKGDTGLDLYQSMQDVFLQLASPFALYAQRFADLEDKHSRVVAGMVSKDIQQTVGSVSSTSMNLQTLQEATGRLKDLASFIFPIVDGSLDRFELLNGGYRAKEALRSVDKIVSNHLEELIIAIRSMSAAMTGDANKLVMEFDEQHVLCAMEVLKIVGNFRRDLRNFEGGTRTRMKSLSERMEDYHAQEAIFKSIVESNSSFSLPDSLSIVEIDSYLTKVFCGDNDANTDANKLNPSLATLQNIYSSASSQRDNIYSNTEEAIKRFATSCHSFVFDVCSAVPSKHLNELTQMQAWRENSSATGDLDSYGTLPQQYITQVGEHMLSLVQAFEPFASDPTTLSLVNEAMDGVRDVALQPWSEFIGAAGFVGSDSTISTMMNGKDIADLVLSNSALGEEDAALEEGATEDEIASASFCNAWLDVIGLAVTGRLLEKIMRIPQLTPKGCEHLTADLNYLVNVFSALGVTGHPHPLVTHMSALATLSDGDLEAQIKSRNTSSEVENALRAVEARMALRRGISID
jgi:hypothetical protein